MRYRFLVFVFTLLIGLGGYAQNMLSGFIIDEKTRDPLAGVTIVDAKSGKGSISDEKGEFSLMLSEFPIVLSIRHIGYFVDSLIVENKELYQKYFEGKTVSLTLRVNPFLLDEVVVSTPGLATKLFADEPYAIIDYVVKNDRFIGLGYKNQNPLKREIFLGTLSGKILESIPIPSFQEIYQDCLGEVYAITKDRAYLLSITNDTISLTDVCDAGFFEEMVKPIQALNNQYFIGVDKSEKGQYHDYYVCDSETGQQEIFYRVGNDQKEKAVASIDKQVRREFVGKISRGNIESGELRIINARIALLQNRINTDYRPIQSSMFQLKDSVLLFDFDYQAVHCFKMNAELLWRSEIQIYLSKDFTGRVHHDKISNRFSLEFLNIQQSYLIEIDPRTGGELETIPIQKFKHIDHISVYNNRIFFLHQPDFGERGKKLYFLDI